MCAAPRTACWSCITTPDLADGRAIVDVSAADLPAHVPDLDAALDACAACGSTSRSRTTRTIPTSTRPIRIADRTVAALSQRGEDERWLISSFRLETIDRCKAFGRRHSHGVAGDGGARRRDRDDGQPRSRGAASVGRHRCAGRTSTCVTAPASRSTPGRATTRSGWRELIEWGIDGICTNVPDVAIDSARRSMAGDRSRGGARRRVDQLHRVRPVFEPQLQRLAEVVAVELKRERTGRGDGEARQIGLHVDGVRRLHASAAQRAAEGAEDGADLQRLERDGDQSAVQVSPPG